MGSGPFNNNIYDNNKTLQRRSPYPTRGLPLDPALRSNGPIIDTVWTFWLRALSVSGPFSIDCVVHADCILLNARTSARRAPTFFVYADFVSIVCMRTYSSHTRTVFIYQHPEWTFLVTRASGADHSLREWIFFFCLRGARIQYSIKRTRPPRADLFRSRRPLIFYVRTLSLARGPFFVTHARTFSPNFSRARASRTDLLFLARRASRARGSARTFFSQGGGRPRPLTVHH